MRVTRFLLSCNKHSASPLSVQDLIILKALLFLPKLPIIKPQATIFTEICVFFSGKFSRHHSKLENTRYLTGSTITHLRSLFYYQNNNKVITSDAVSFDKLFLTQAKATHGKLLTPKAKP
jgi:hypothetical protein